MLEHDFNVFTTTILLLLLMVDENIDDENFWSEMPFAMPTLLNIFHFISNTRLIRQKIASLYPTKVAELVVTNTMKLH